MVDCLSYSFSLVYGDFLSMNGPRKDSVELKGATVTEYINICKLFQ